MVLLRVEQVDGYKLSLVQNISTCNWKLKFSMKTHQTHITFYLKIAMLDVLNVEDGDVYSTVLKNKTATMFFLKKKLF